MLTSSRQRGAPQILQQHAVARNSFFLWYSADAKRHALNNKQVNKQTANNDDARLSSQHSQLSATQYRYQCSWEEQKCGFGELGQVQLLLRRKQQLDGL